MDSKEIVLNFHKHVLEKGDTRVVSRYAKRDVILYSPYLTHPQKGVRHFQAFLDSVFSSISQRKVTMNDIIAEGNKVAVRWTLAGIDSGEFMNIPPTGNPVNISIVSIYRLTNEKIAEVWAIDTAFWRQSGF